MNLKLLKEFIKKTLNETERSETLNRVNKTSEAVGGDSKLLKYIVDNLDDHTLNEILDKIEGGEFDARKGDLIVADPKTNIPINSNINTTPVPGSSSAQRLNESKNKKNI